MSAAASRRRCVSPTSPKARGRADVGLQRRAGSRSPPRCALLASPATLPRPRRQFRPGACDLARQRLRARRRGQFIRRPAQGSGVASRSSTDAGEWDVSRSAALARPRIVAQIPRFRTRSRARAALDDVDDHRAGFSEIHRERRALVAEKRRCGQRGVSVSVNRITGPSIGSTTRRTTRPGCRVTTRSAPEGRARDRRRLAARGDRCQVARRSTRRRKLPGARIAAGRGRRLGPVADEGSPPAAATAVPHEPCPAHPRRQSAAPMAVLP